MSKRDLVDKSDDEKDRGDMRSYAGLLLRSMKLDMTSEGSLSYELNLQPRFNTENLFRTVLEL